MCVVCEKCKQTETEFIRVNSYFFKCLCGVQIQCTYHKIKYCDTADM